MTRPKLTVCVITLDEADHIQACLASADFADEWIVVDSGSTDGTRDIAAEFGATVVEREWPGHVAQKNAALDLASHDWVLSLDADERVSPELRAAVLAALDGVGDGDDTSAFSCNRRTWYLGRWIRHGGWYPDRKVRLFRRSTARWGGVDPHDHVEPTGPVTHLQGDLLHYSYDSLSDHLRTIDSFTSIAATEKWRAGRRAGLVDLTLRPFWKFLRMYLFRGGFLDGWPGLVVAATGSFYVFLKYAKLRELGLGGGAGHGGSESP